MNVTELFRRLSYGELSNLSIGGEGSGVIPEASRPKLVSYLNTALLRIYSRFVLRESSLVIECQEWITNYHLTKRFAMTSEPCDGVTRYIQDHAADPFQDDVIKVMDVLNQEGQRVGLNDLKSERSVFTPQPNVLQVPQPVQGYFLSVLYQARHVPIAYTDYEACIEIPAVLEEALQMFMAHLVFFHMNGQDNGIKAAGYLKNYELACGLIVDRDLVNSSVADTNSKFHERGFV